MGIWVKMLMFVFDVYTHATSATFRWSRDQLIQRVLVTIFFSRFCQERDINSFQFILFLLQRLEMSIFSNINVFDDHLMYHKTTRSYLEVSGN